MSVNSSSFADFPPPPNVSSNSSDFNICTNTKTFIYIFSAFSIVTVLLIPLLLFVLYLGYQKSRKQHSSHSDHFTYHSIFLQLNGLLGLAFFFIGGNISLREMWDVGLSLYNMGSLGQGLFHLLTCVERYLAVVHPVTYLGLRQGGGVRIRNISTGCAWFLICGYLTVTYLGSSEFNEVLYYSIVTSFLSVISFCSLSVLYVLKRPGPGGGGTTGERVDPSKKRAFYTITAIMGVLLLRIAGNLIANLMNISVCLVVISSSWLGLPSSLVLPLLFLHRVGGGGRQCCKHNTESG